MKRTTHIYLFTLLFLFIIGNSKIEASVLNSNSYSSNIQRVRIDFKMPDGFTRHLLLSFTKDNSASDAYDYGYDALNADAFPYDLNWLVDDQRCVIQGVGAFDESKKYPFWMFMSKAGDIEISLDRLENFEAPINLFIYDALLDSYTSINESNYKTHMQSGEYTDRFYLAFKETSEPIVAKNSLSTNDEILASTKVHYSKKSNELIISTNNNIKIEAIDIYNIASQNLYSKKTTAYSGIKIPLSLNSNAYYIINLLTDKGLLTKKIMVL